MEFEMNSTCIHWSVCSSGELSTKLHQPLPKPVHALTHAYVGCYEYRSADSLTKFTTKVLDFSDHAVPYPMEGVLLVYGEMGVTE